MLKMHEVKTDEPAYKEQFKKLGNGKKQVKVNQILFYSYILPAIEGEVLKRKDGKYVYQFKIFTMYENKPRSTVLRQSFGFKTPEKAYAELSKVTMQIIEDQLKKQEVLNI